VLVLRGPFRVLTPRPVHGFERISGLPEFVARYSFDVAGTPGPTLLAMPNWTRKNFNALRDVSPPDVPIEWRFARTALESPELGVSRFTYEPGARMPWGHRHRVQEELYVIIAGSGRAKLDDEVIEIGTWDALRVAPEVIRSFEAGSDGLDVICIGGRKPDGPDSERYPDFWD
jgi:quercetin dioxygenase-like cupin family protein